MRRAIRRSVATKWAVWLADGQPRFSTSAASGPRANPDGAPINGPLHRRLDGRSRDGCAPRRTFAKGQPHSPARRSEVTVGMRDMEAREARGRESSAKDTGQY